MISPSCSQAAFVWVAAEQCSETLRTLRTPAHAVACGLFLITLTSPTFTSTSSVLIHSPIILCEVAVWFRAKRLKAEFSSTSVWRAGMDAPRTHFWEEGWGSCGGWGLCQPFPPAGATSQFPVCRAGVQRQGKSHENWRNN